MSGKRTDEKHEKLRHTASHVLAEAISRLYPAVKLGIGPATEDGFYYDFDFSALDESEGASFLTEEDLPVIEEEMRRIVKEASPMRREAVTAEDARELFSEQPYKLELIEGLPEGEEVSIFTNGEFKDLCKGPHLENTGQVASFKLLSLAGAYWKGDETQPMLQRVYGTAFFDRKQLKAYLNMLEEAKKRDHRVLGTALDLFGFDERAGAGLVIYHPKGALLRQLIIDHITEQHLKRGYQLISSPHIMRSDTWVQSGHYDHYKDNMYVFEKDGQEYAVKPMNCPGHIMVYSSRTRSYRDLPLRFFELGSVYRHEKSGTLHGLLRVRGFTQDDAHIFCLPEQASEEIIKVIEFVEETLKVFGFDEFDVDLATMPEDRIGSDEAWEQATSALEDALRKKGIEYDIKEGDGAFYGPKIDIELKDALGRSWQCATVQCDFALPERFDMEYIDSDGNKQRPIVLHRVILGSLERFIGALIEHHGGAFPFWLAPEQVRVVPVGEDQYCYAEELKDILIRENFRATVDLKNEKMQKKVRAAELDKVPYAAIVGAREAEAREVSVRSKKEGRMGSVTIDEFLMRLKEENKH